MLEDKSKNQYTMYLIFLPDIITAAKENSKIVFKIIPLFKVINEKHNIKVFKL